MPKTNQYGHKPEELDRRNRAMLAKYLAGETQVDIGRAHGVKGTAAWHAINLARQEAGITDLKAFRDAAMLGVTVEERNFLQAIGAIAAFKAQKDNAKSRGIAFRLSLPDWWSVWSASGRFDRRGKGRGRYCMSRIGDEGAYELGNVFIQRIEQNASDSAMRMLAAGRMAHQRRAAGVVSEASHG